MVKYSPADNRYEKMQYKFCGASGLKLPAISVGLWHNFGGTDDFLNAALSLQKAFDCGITHFDLANNYGPPAGSADGRVSYGHGHRARRPYPDVGQPQFAARRPALVADFG